MAYQLATAFVSVQAKNGLSAAFSQIKSQVGSLLTGIGNISPVLGAVAGFAGLTYAISNAMGAAEEAIDAEARLNAIIRATGNVAQLSSKDVLEMSKKLQDTGIFASTDITKATTALIQMRAVTASSFPEIIRLSQDVAAAGFGSVESAARTLGKALADPARGLFRLRSIGITFTQQEQLQIHALAKVNDLLGAQKIILDKVRDSVGGTNDALAKTPAGQWMQIKHQLADVSEELGKHILPIAVRIGREVLRITQIVAPLVNRALDINEQLGGWPVKIGLAAISAALLAKGIGKISSAWTEMLAMMTAASTSNPIGIWFAGIGAILVALVAEYTAIWWYLNRFPKFTEAWANLVTHVWVALKQIGTAIAEVYQASLKLALAWMPQWIKNLPFIKALLEEGIVGVIVYVLKKVADGITVIGAFIKTIADIGSAVQDVTANSINKLKSGIDALFIRVRGILNMFVAFRAAGEGIGGMFVPLVKTLDIVLDQLTRATVLSIMLGRLKGDFAALYNANLKSAKLDIELARLAERERQKQRAAKGGGAGGIGSGNVLDIAPGLSGLQDAWKNVQDALLKKDNPAERTAAGVESLDSTAEKMLDELMAINGKTAQAAVAGV